MTHAAAPPRGTVRSAIDDLPFFWKLLIPFLTLIVLVGAVGAFLIVRDLSARAQRTLERDLANQALEARSFLRDKELYLLESANFAANITGMAAAVRDRDEETVARLLRSVLALKRDLDVLAAVSGDGVAIVEFLRPSPDAEPARHAAGSWPAAFLEEALRTPSGDKSSRLVPSGGGTMLAIAAPVCSGVRECSPTGVSIVGMALGRLSDAARGKSSGRFGTALVDRQGRILAASGLGVPDAASLREGVPSFNSRPSRGIRLATLAVPFEVQGRRVGTLAVSQPRDPAFAAARQAGLRLVLVLFAAIAGVVAIGLLVTRLTLGRLRTLVATNRALGRGDLSVRAPSLGRDEVGELAQGVNQMAEQLQAMYQTLELRVAQRTEEVERLLRERTEFFASISHELRTPLAVIIQQAEMLLDPTYPRNGRFGTEAGRSIKGAADQLQLLVKDVLDMAKAERGVLALETEDVRIADVVADMRQTIEALAGASGLHTDIRVPPDLPAVRADPRRVREIIQNLVDNAIKYTAEGGRVSLSATAGTNGSVQVCVADTGVGIPAGTGDRIFQPFAMVQGSRPQHGQASTGLGLALSKRLVEAQGGAIGYVSEEGAGTTFTFTLPKSEQGGGP